MSKPKQCHQFVFEPSHGPPRRINQEKSCQYPAKTTSPQEDSVSISAAGLAALKQLDQSGDNQ